MSDNNVDNINILRPIYLKDFIGQDLICNNLKIYINAAKSRDEPLEHVLFYGPPGLGKTTLAYIIANEMGTNIQICSAPAIEKLSDIAMIFTSLKPGDIVFIDEIHRLPKIVEESLYTAMEDFKFSIVINKEYSPKIITIDLPPFTLIGATTKLGNLEPPFLSRFGIIEKLNFYNNNDLANVIISNASKLGFKIDKLAALEIAKRSRGTPRITNRILKRVRDFALFEKTNKINITHVKKGCSALKIDANGLNELDLDYIKSLICRFNGGPVSLNSLANSIGEEPTNLSETCEPYLIMKNYINITNKGRVATNKCLKEFSFFKKE